jgi:putative pyruvate formate lyase activating enzyme
VVDIYMPDMKYSSPDVGERLSLVREYPKVNFAAVKEMNRQVGPLQLDEEGIAVRGVLVRHLVLPNGLAGTERVARYLAEEVSRETYINVMAQYRPEYRAMECEGMGRRPTRMEYLEAVSSVIDAGLHRLDGRSGHRL